MEGKDWHQVPGLGQGAELGDLTPPQSQHHPPAPGRRQPLPPTPGPPKGSLRARTLFGGGGKRGLRSLGCVSPPALLQPLSLLTRFLSQALNLSRCLSAAFFLSLLPCLSLPESFAERRWPSPSGSESAAADGGAGNSRVEERRGNL